MITDRKRTFHPVNIDNNSRLASFYRRPGQGPQER